MPPVSGVLPSLMSQTLHTENAACVLTVTLTLLTTKSIRLEYSVLNRTAEPLYLCNLFWKDSHVNPATREEQFEVSPNDVYVRIEDDHLHVALSIIKVYISDGIGVRFIPLLTRVEPQQQFAASLSLALPLAPYLKTKNAPPAGGPILLPLHFELGYFLGDAPTQEQIKPAFTGSGNAYQVMPLLFNSQQVIAAGPFSEAVAVAPWLGKDISRPWN
jgi:hypothetical protein